MTAIIPPCTRVVIGSEEIRTPADLRQALGVELVWMPEHEVCRGHAVWEDSCLCKSIDINASVERAKRRGRWERGAFLVEEV